MQRQHYFLYKQCLSCSHNEIIHKLVPIVFTQGGKFLPLGGKKQVFPWKKTVYPPVGKNQSKLFFQRKTKSGILF